MNADIVKLNLDISSNLNNIIVDLAQKMNVTKSVVLRRSIALMIVAIQEKENGNILVVFDENENIVNKIVGL